MAAVGGSLENDSSIISSTPSDLPPPNLQESFKSSSPMFTVKFDETKSPESLEVFLNNTRQGHSAQYSKVSEALRRLGSSSHKTQSLQCAAFCGGKHCKYEDTSRWLNEEGVAFKGLFSHWVTDKLLAMARPSTQLFTEYSLLQQFLECGINAVVNLQTSGEHSQCGPGLETCGFTYLPEELMKNGIYFYNYPLPDYGAPEVSMILDVVKVIDFSCGCGKVAVHCHAGLGRTGVVLACYLLYSQRVNPEEAIATVRAKRPGSIQTRGQLELIERFSNYLRSLWRMYPSQSNFTSTDITGYLQRQTRLLHGDEEKKYRHLPKVLDMICGRLKALGQDGGFVFRCQLHTQLEAGGSAENSEGQENHVDLQTSSDSVLRASNCCYSDFIKVAVQDIEEEINSKWKWLLLAEESDPTVLFLLLFNYFIRLCDPLLGHRDKNDEFWPSLQKHQKAILTLTMDTIKSVLSMEDISKNIDSISKLLTGVFSRRRLLSSQDNIESDEEDTVTEAALREYLLSNSTSNNQIL